MERDNEEEELEEEEKQDEVLQTWAAFLARNRLDLTKKNYIPIKAILFFQYQEKDSFIGLLVCELRSVKHEPSHFRHCDATSFSDDVVWYFGETQKDSKPEDKSKSKPPAISQSGSTKQLYVSSAAWLGIGSGFKEGSAHEACNFCPYCNENEIPFQLYIFWYIPLNLYLYIFRAFREIHFTITVRGLRPFNSLTVITRVCYSSSRTSDQVNLSESSVMNVLYFSNKKNFIFTCWEMQWISKGKPNNSQWSDRTGSIAKVRPGLLLRSQQRILELWIMGGIERWAMSGLQRQVTTNKEEKCRDNYKHAKTSKIA